VVKTAVNNILRDCVVYCGKNNNQQYFTTCVVYCGKKQLVFPTHFTTAAAAAPTFVADEGHL